MRSFIAIEIDDGVRRELAAFQQLLRVTRAQVRWVRPEAMHLTLAFLGEVDETALDGIQTAMTVSAEASAPLQLEFCGTGTFGPPRSPRVVWVDIRHDVKGLLKLQSSLAASLRAIGFETESRPFAPHITLGRIHGPLNLDEMMKRVDKASHRSFGTIEATRLTLFKSDLHPEGATHTPVFHADLKR
jgi:2'-5' RNA ligase